MGYFDPEHRFMRQYNKRMKNPKYRAKVRKKVQRQANREGWKLKKGTDWW